MSANSRYGAMLEGLQAEHHKLNCVVSAIRHLLDDSVANSSSAVLLGLLNSLRCDLLAHFAAESDGCLNDVATRCPSTAGKIKAIETEHRQLVQSLDGLLEQSRTRAGAAPQLRSRLNAFADQLHAHEAAESRLVQYAFGGDTSDYDVEGND